MLAVAAPVLARAQAAPAPATSAPAAPGGASAPGAATTPAAPAERIHIEGFRSAQWGMTEPQVKAAVQKDFNVAADKIRPEENLAERTTVLTVTVPDLLEGVGPGRVSYIFGFTSKKLIQVNVLWGTPVDPQAAPEKIVAAANQLRQLFLDSSYEPETIASNVRLNDGSVLVFEGADPDKHTTTLRLAVAAASQQKGKPDKVTPDKVTEAVLSLSYIMDARNPDIYRLKKGQF
ncbi:MAG: hypothetical protein JO001_14445 [Alphaproteobacteria bacterium]|nr:hypothetical protein [Alphaproteobacteria bacterium]